MRKKVSITCRDENRLRPPYHSWVLLRADFDAWLASKAEEAGALLACSILVDDVVWEGDRIVGIQAEMTSFWLTWLSVLMVPIPCLRKRPDWCNRLLPTR